MSPVDPGASTQEVCEFLCAQGLEVYGHALRDHHVDGWVFARLDEDHLKELGVLSIGHRKRLLAAIGERARAAGIVPATGGGDARAATPATAESRAPASGAVTAAAPRSMKIFLSYGRDAYVSEVRALKDALEARGHEVWFDQDRKFGAQRSVGISAIQGLGIRRLAFNDLAPEMKKLEGSADLGPTRD